VPFWDPNEDTGDARCRTGNSVRNGAPRSGTWQAAEQAVDAGLLSGPGELSYRTLMDWVGKKPGTERRLLNTGA
jgi:hypothetical protein